MRNAASPKFAVTVCKEAMRYVRNRIGSLSALSSDSHATGRSQSATHSLTSVVLPKPAGAEMRVTLCPTPRLWRNPSFSRSTNRGRTTTFDLSRGMCSLVAKMGTGMDAL
jgi:hypothetical protein